MQDELRSADEWEAIKRLDRDLRTAAKSLGRKGARNLTDYYYQVQKFRTMSANQVRASMEGDSPEPNQVVAWLFKNMKTIEGDIQRALGEFAASYNVGQWLQSITGIGPVLSAGFLAHLEMEPWICPEVKNGEKKCSKDAPHGPACMRQKMVTAGHFWRFAGLDPTMKWEKKKKRPWNARLKVLCYKAEDCFVKFQNNKNDHYGKWYVQRKAREVEKNELLHYKDQAERILTEKKFGDDTEAKKHYLAGKLPPAHIHMRAMRWTVKIFLSHLHHVMHVDYFGTEPPIPYAFDKCPEDHRHFIPIPNWPFQGTGKSLKTLSE